MQVLRQSDSCVVEPTAEDIIRTFPYEAKLDWLGGDTTRLRVVHGDQTFWFWLKGNIMTPCESPIAPASAQQGEVA